MIAHSLRLRMMGLAVFWVVLSLIAAGVALQYLFSINLERTTRVELEAALARLAAIIVTDTSAPSLSSPLPDPRYATPFGGRYWQVQAVDNDLVARSRSLWDFIIDPLETTEGLHHSDGPEGRHLIALTRRLAIENGSVTREYLVTAAQDHGPTHDAAQQFSVDLMQVLAPLGALILLLAWMQIKLGLAPVRTVENAIEAVRQGSKPRLEGVFPSELHSLVQEVNDLLDARDAMTEGAKARAADLAHGLKTPLAAVHGIAEKLRESGQGAEADMLQDLSFEMSERIDYQLRLASLRVRTAHASRASLNTAVLRTLTVLKRTGRGELLNWSAELADDCQVDIDRQDLMELVGVTLENAAKWARTRVVIRSWRTEKHAFLEICDDGPGVPPEQLSTLGIRGRRLDQSLPGSGLGLAIAYEILQINHGSIYFDIAPQGGLIVKMQVPLARGDSQEVS